ncbi:MAG: ABC transporter substrate-binding protein [Clostridiales bacterium]|nr:ABC transporter substrate-binding protein [Clostridiales bacterium]
MKKNIFMKAMLSLLPALLLSSCAVPSPEETSAPAGPEASTATEVLSAPDPSVNSLFALPYCCNENGFFNPILRHSSVNGPLFSLLYDGLFKIGASGNPEPLIAESLSVSGTSVTIKLRPDAVFHDGSSILASDVVWSLEMAKTNTDSVYCSRLKNVTDISASGNGSVVLTLEKNQGSIEYLLDIPIIKRGTGLSSGAVGSGRYKIVESDDSMYLIANESWFARPMDSRFPINLILLTRVDDQDSLVYSLVSGNASLVRLDPFDSPELRLSGNCDIYKVQSRDFLYIAFNTSYYADTGDSGIRKALSSAIDVRGLLENVWDGVQYTGGLYPESITGIAAEPSSADAEAAAAALRAEGCRNIAGKWYNSDGKQLSFTIVCGKASKKYEAARYIAENLAALGLECKVVATENLSAVIKSGNFDIAVCETTLSPDYDFRFLLASDGEQNFNRFTVSGLDTLLDSFFSVGHTQSQRTANQINSLVSESQPIIPIGYKIDSVCVNREFSIGNIAVSDSDVFAGLFDWTVY